VAGILIFSETTVLALELLTAADIIAADRSMVKAVSINDHEQAAEIAAKGVDALAISDPGLNLADTAAVASALRQAAGQSEAGIILLASNRKGKELAGRLAQIWDAGCLSDVKAITCENGMVLCERNVLGGAAVALQRITADKQVIAVSPRALPVSAGYGEGKVVKFKADIKPSLRLVETRAKAGDSVKIEEAEIILVVGQGVENIDDLPVISAIANALGGEVACSKPVATDKKWLSEERIVGLSGKICKPQLAIILGVSGQVQFTVGIRDSHTIVSINNDEKAFMNQMADYILIADLKEVIPELKKKLS